MKSVIPFFKMMFSAIICGFMIVSCGESGGKFASKSEKKSESLERIFVYKNLYTEEILDSLTFIKFRKNILFNFADTIYSSFDPTKVEGYKVPDNVDCNFIYYEKIVNNDSIIQPFTYDIRVGDEYVIRRSFEKNGMDISPQIFKAIDGNNIQIGGKQEKPILLNLWFVECPGCIEEIPALNKLQEKYGDKVDFVAMTFNDKEKVSKFLKQKKFNFRHITNVEDYIKRIATYPYPENIFIGKDGHIRYIEGLIRGSKDFDYFESIFEKLLKE